MYYILIPILIIIFIIIVFHPLSYHASQFNSQDQEIFWTKVTLIGTLTSAIAIIITVLLTVKTISENTDERLRNREVNEAQIYISLRDLFSKHEEVQKSLKGGKWNERDQGSITESNPGEELAKVDSYLRFYEYCYVLIDNRIINPKTFKEMYGPYIDDIKRNYQIMQIIDEEGWPLFNNLLKRLDKINDLESTKPDFEKKYSNNE